MNIQKMISLLFIVGLTLNGCATSNQLPDGSVDKEYGIPIRAMNKFYLVQKLVDGRKIYYMHVEEDDARCFILVKPNGATSYAIAGRSKREHWVCVLHPPGQRYWVLVETRGVGHPKYPFPHKYTSEKEAYIVGKVLMLKRAGVY